MVIDGYTGKMALRGLLVLAILISCLLSFHHVMEAIITDYTHLHNQRQRLLIELTDATQNKCPKKERRPRQLHTNSLLVFVVFLGFPEASWQVLSLAAWPRVL